MTLDELKKIDSAANSARHEQEGLRNAAQRLAALRNGEACNVEAVMKSMTYFNYSDDATAKKAFYQVLNEQIADALRIAELRLEARARAAGAKHRALTEQVRSFFDEEAQP